MDIRNCRRCGKMFNINVTRKPICPECEKKEEEDFETARDYVKENPGCSIRNVAEETGVSKNLIMKFVKEKRLEFSDGSSLILTCESCGAPISSGRYCNHCLSKLGKEMMEQSTTVKKILPDSDKQSRKSANYTKFNRT